MKTRALRVALGLVLLAVPLFAGTAVIKSRNYINFNGTIFTETFTMSYQVFTGSTDCSSGGGAVATVHHIDSVTGFSFPITAADSFKLTFPLGRFYSAGVSEQNGPFVGWGRDAGDRGTFTSLDTP